MIHRVLIATVVVTVSLTVVTSAWAYDETGKSDDPAACHLCHSANDVDVAGTEAARQGPHGGYSTTSSACGSCHRVHSATGSSSLLPGQTVTETCELCHDGTGGSGVYGTLNARGVTVEAAHRTETTDVVPGGDIPTGGSATRVFSGYGGTLSCGDCHSVHGAGTVEPFTTDRARNDTDTAGFLSNQLLRRQPTGAGAETAKYGSDWCVGCHAGRAQGEHDIINHPVEAGSGSGIFTYESLQIVEGVNSNRTVSGSLGRSNFGYVMPVPRTAGQSGHAPICQQCHEDMRNVGDQVSGRIAESEVFQVTTADGTTESDNPRFQVFPHESSNAGMLVETGDDLCTNCHTRNQLQ